MVPPVVSGSERSFRMSYEIVPVPPAQMSHHIDPAEKPEAKTAQTEVSQVLFRLSRWENLEYAKKI